ncbi:MAG: hypothetical protein ACOC2H_01035 [Spirochaetota bacterium]
MTTLQNLICERNMNALLVSDNFPRTYPDHLRGLRYDMIPQSGDICIRDRRDSDRDTIFLLKQSFRTVITLDDCGEGIKEADCSINLLPTVSSPLPEYDEWSFPFLYGYHFYTHIKSLYQTYHRDIDICVYTNREPDEYPIDLLKRYPSLRICFFYGSRIRLGDFSVDTAAHYTEILLRSRICVSHFGLTLYEASLCGARPVAVNPTQYHSRLADNDSTIGIVNCGTFDSPDLARLDGVIDTTPDDTVTDIFSVKHRMETHCANFFSALERICR